MLDEGIPSARGDKRSKSEVECRMGSEEAKGGVLTMSGELCLSVEDT